MEEKFSAVVRVSWEIDPAGSLAKAIRAHGIRTVASAVGASVQTIANYASGAYPIPDEAMIRICRMVGHSVPSLTVRQSYDARADMRSERLTWRANVRRKAASDA